MIENMALSISKTLILFLLHLIPASLAQQGHDCSASKACGVHQSCYVGRCVCEMGFVRTGPHCNPVRDYGEPCIYDLQCIDHRMSCQSIDANSTNKLCLCDKLHEWNTESKVCVEALNITVLLKSLVGDDPSTDIMREADSIFVSLGWAGITVAVLLVLLGTGLIIYGCCLYECYDKCVGDHSATSQCPPTCVNYKRCEAKKRSPEPRSQQADPCMTEVGLCLDFS